MFTLWSNPTVYVLPLPVCPMARKVQSYPSNARSINGFTNTSYTSAWAADPSNTLSNIYVRNSDPMLTTWKFQTSNKTQKLRRKYSGSMAFVWIAYILIDLFNANLTIWYGRTPPDCCPHMIIHFAVQQVVMAFLDDERLLRTKFPGEKSKLLCQTWKLWFKSEWLVLKLPYRIHVTRLLLVMLFKHQPSTQSILYTLMWPVYFYGKKTLVSFKSM